MVFRERVRFFAAVALSLAIGWGIRGNFGHETGAMIPGALAALAAILLSRRPDWLQRIGSFGFFGAVGWSFGGSISYMQVIAYTHSGHSLSVLYGFACLFAIGFLWAIFGGAGTALPAFLGRAELNAVYPLVFLIFGAWCVQDWLVGYLIHVDPAFRQRDPLYWYDTDWLGISVALVTAILYSACRRRLDFGSRLAIWLCVGWWCGFAGFVPLLGWRMTPPRGDNWAGCAGMAAALCVFLWREKQRAWLYSALLCGIWGGIGFAFANFLKLLGISTGWQTNWHSVLEQTYGLINGIGIAAIMLVVRKHASPANDPGNSARQTSRAEKIAVLFVLFGITYLNFSKNVETWVKAGAMPPEMYGIRAREWFNLAYALGAAVVALALFRCPNLFGATRHGRAQILYLVLLWWVVIGNFERALVSFAAQRLITEGLIFVNAVICTSLVLLAPRLETVDQPVSRVGAMRFRVVPIAAAGAVVIAILLPWAMIRAFYGDQQIGYAARHIRFGPQATASKEKPDADQPHP